MDVLGATTLSVTTVSITTLSAKELVNDTEHKWHRVQMTFSIALPCVKGHFAECHVLFTNMLSVVAPYGLVGHQNTQHNDIQHNDTQHEGLICDTRYNNTAIVLSVTNYLLLC
jgi:hypothetical protein